MQRDESKHFFENIYKNSNKDHTNVPWAAMQPNNFLIEFLDEPRAHTGKAVVIGCGLGDDAVALYEAGYDVTAIDISASAIAWCKERFCEYPIEFIEADLFDLDANLLESFDFAFECRTIQSLALMHRDTIIQAIASLLKPQGMILAVANGKQEDQIFDGPPWPLTVNELKLFGNHGCNELQFSIFADDDDNMTPLLLRGLFQKA